MFNISKKTCSVIVASVCLVATSSFGVDLKTEVQKDSYSIGVSTGNYLLNQLSRQAKLGIESDIDVVIEGVVDALKQKQKFKDDEVLTHLNNRAEVLNEIQKKNFKKLLDKNLAEGKKYLAKNKKNKKVKVTKSGLQYEILKAGKGKKPKEENVVEINYKASLIDGTSFDNTYDRKMPAKLSMISVVDGLKEGLLLMREGSKFRMVIPSELAYGDTQIKDIPAGSTVIFEVELDKVLKAGGKKKEFIPNKTSAH